MPSTGKLLFLSLLAALVCRFPPVLAAELDPKIACRAEEIITSLAGTAPDKLDFFGKRTGKDNYACEAYFGFKVYADVWARVNAMMPGLRKVEAACAANALVKLPKVNTLQLQYTITAGGKYRITGAGDLPTDPAKLSKRLRAQLAQLQGVRDADDATLHASLALADCPLAKYPDIQ